VERFQQLVQWARDNQGAEKGLRSLLKLCRSGWPEAIEHAFSAVVIDNRPRMWMPRDSPEGLVRGTAHGLGEGGMDGLVASSLKESTPGGRSWLCTMLGALLKCAQATRLSE
jgi:hypothetical protein